MNIAFIFILISIVCFLLQTVVPGFEHFFLLVSSEFWQRPWMIVTSMFLHGDITHLMFNMLGLYFFGPLLSNRIGTKRFIAVYFIAGVLASIGSLFLYTAALGASGALMGVLGVLIILMPNLRVMVSMIVPMPLWMAGIVWVVLDTLGIFVPNGVANAAHLIGLGVGLSFGLFLRNQKERVVKRIRGKNHLSEDDMQSYMQNGRL